MSTLGDAACCGDAKLAVAARNYSQRKHATPAEQAGDDQAVSIMANSTAAILGKLGDADTHAVEDTVAALPSQMLQGAEEPADVRASSLRSAKPLEPGTPAQSLEPITKKSLGSLGAHRALHILGSRPQSLEDLSP